MNKDYIIESKNPGLYNYYWSQIKTSATKFDALDSFKAILASRAQSIGSDILDPQMTNDLCKTAVLALFMEIAESSDDIGYALEYLKNDEINNDRSSYINKLIDSTQKILSKELPEISKSKQLLDINKLRTHLTSTVNKFYSEHPEYRGASIPVKGLQNEVTKVFDNAFEIRKTLKQDQENTLGFNKK